MYVDGGWRLQLTGGGLDYVGVVKPGRRIRTKTRLVL